MQVSMTTNGEDKQVAELYIRALTGSDITLIVETKTRRSTKQVELTLSAGQVEVLREILANYAARKAAR